MPVDTRPRRVIAAGALFAVAGGGLALYGLLVLEQSAQAGRAIVALIAVFAVFGSVAVHRAGDSLCSARPPSTEPAIRCPALPRDRSGGGKNAVESCSERFRGSVYT